MSMGPTQPPIQWVAASFSQEAKWTGLHLESLHSLSYFHDMTVSYAQKQHYMLYFKVPHLCDKVSRIEKAPYETKSDLITNVTA